MMQQKPEFYKAAFGAIEGYRHESLLKENFNGHTQLHIIAISARRAIRAPVTIMVSN
jgi:hypothetical protein